MTSERKAVIETSRVKTLDVTVEYVFRANFNDSYLLDSVSIPLDSLADKPLVWFDPYNGRRKQGETLVALAACSDGEFVILKRSGDAVEERAVEVPMSFTLCEDYDESLLIAAHIRPVT